MRQTIKDLGGTMPEELPVVESIKKIETQQRKRLGKAETPEIKKSEQPDMALHKDFPQSPHASLNTAGVADYRSVIGYFDYCQERTGA